MEESQILLSIIIPAFNAEKYVEKCISRIIPVLENDIECIIVDDGSIDNIKIFMYNKLTESIKVNGLIQT